MACFKPLTAYRLSNGDVTFVERGDVISQLSLPCGQCVGCRLARSREWATRCMHESSRHLDNCFITLTYDDDNLPSDLSLNHKHFQKFFKRLRKRFNHRTIRYYMAGEYGELNQRPHYHACIFGLQLPFDEPIQRSPSGHVIYRSQALEELWPMGFSSVAEFNWQTAAYVARYVMKKVTGQAADTHYQMVNTETGEIFWRVPEYNRMSLKPGIGHDWIKNYKGDVYPYDEVIVNGFPTKPPRAYDKYLKRTDPDLYDQIKVKRELDFNPHNKDNTPERLEAREQVTLAKLSQLKRKI